MTSIGIIGGSGLYDMLVLASIPTALSLVLEWSGAVDATNVGRLLCALPLGAVAAWIFVQSLRAETQLGRMQPLDQLRVFRTPSSRDEA